MIVHEALKRSLALDSNRGSKPDNQTAGQDSLISLLIHDIFGGEILKTHKKNNWHFYNRVDGERVDFTRPEIDKTYEDNRFEDIPSTPDETYEYFELEDYSPIFMRFVSTFEEAVGLEHYKVGWTS